MFLEFLHVMPLFAILFLALSNTSSHKNLFAMIASCGGLLAGYIGHSLGTPISLFDPCYAYFASFFVSAVSFAGEYFFHKKSLAS